MNDKIDELLVNEDIIKITNKAAVPFIDSLSKDEIKTCIISAIWNAINSYNEDYKVKFTTFLYRGVVLECLKQKKSNDKLKLVSIGDRSFVCKKNDMARVEMVDEISKCEDPELIYDRFYNNKTLSEIAIQRGVSKETVRLKIQKNLSILKNRLEFSV